MAPTRGTGITYAVAERPLPGELVSGDRSVVVTFAGGAILAAIDGLGHGPEAADASAVAAKTLEELAESGDPVALIQECLERLRSTRGAAMTVARVDFEKNALSWAGVGNVEGIVLRAPGESRRQNDALMTRGGVVGFRIPQIRLSSVDLDAGDTIILMTDGIGAIGHDPLHLAPPSEIANDILSRYGKETDDALVLVARYEVRG